MLKEVASCILGRYFLVDDSSFGKLFNIRIKIFIFIYLYILYLDTYCTLIINFCLEIVKQGMILKTAIYSLRNPQINVFLLISFLMPFNLLQQIENKILNEVFTEMMRKVLQECH